MSASSSSSWRFTFLPIDEDQDLYAPPAEDSDQVGTVAERHKDTKLQTSLTAKHLHNRLLATYYDNTDGDLKIAHCSNVFCIPYFRRR